MAKRKSENSSTETVATDQDADVTLVQDGSTPATEPVATIPSGENGSDGTNTGAVDGNADAHDQAGGPAINPPADALQSALTASGFAHLDELIDMAKVGRSLMSAIDVVRGLPGTFHGWTPAEDPAEIVGDLYEQVETLTEELAALNAKPPATLSAAAVEEMKARVLGVSSPEEKRMFVLTGAVRLDNVLHQENTMVPLTMRQHTELTLATAVEGGWDDGVAL